MNYAKDVKALHHGIAADIPNVDDADGDEILMEVMSAVRRTWARARTTGSVCLGGPLGG